MEKEMLQKQNESTQSAEERSKAAGAKINGIPNSVLQEVFAGRRAASGDMLGHRSALAPSIAAKMSRSFGTDFSGVQLYRSDAMAGTGMHGMASGNRVVLSSEVDLNTMEGQAILGHELSHIRAQSMGIGSGGGLLSDTSLERQADREGALAARGQSVFDGGMQMGVGLSMGFGMQGVEGLTPLSGGLSASAGAPMQASKDDGHTLLDSMDWGKTQDEARKRKNEETGGTVQPYGGTRDRREMLRNNYASFGANPQKNYIPWERNVTFSGGRQIAGLRVGRMSANMNSELTKGYTDEQVSDMFGKILSGADKEDRDSEKYDAERIEGVKMYKEMLYKRLKFMEQTYGKTLTQIHPEDAVERFGADRLQGDYLIAQDVMQLDKNVSDPELRNQILDPENNPEDADFIRLRDYYSPALIMLKNVLDQYNLRKLEDDPTNNFLAVGINNARDMATTHVEGINGPSLSDEQLKNYRKMVAENPDKYNPSYNLESSKPNVVKWKASSGDTVRKQTETPFDMSNRGGKSYLQNRKKRSKMIEEKVGAGRMGTNIRVSDDENGQKREIGGFNPSRSLNLMDTDFADGYTDEQLVDMFEKMTSGKDEKGDFTAGNDPENDKRVFEGVRAYRDMVYNKLLKMEKKYGTLLSQMQPEDIISRIGVQTYTADFTWVQDAEQLVQQSNGEYVNKNLRYEDKKTQQHFLNLKNYFSYINDMIGNTTIQKSMEEMNLADRSITESNQEIIRERKGLAQKMEKHIKGPRMNKKELEKYNEEMRKKKEKGEISTLY